MGNYNNVSRPVNQISSTTIDPSLIEEDITEKIYELMPSKPILYWTNKYAKGKPARNHKFKVMQRHGFDNFDFCSGVTFGADAAGANYSRFALLTLDQSSRPDTKSKIWYYPQDKMVITGTRQVVKVVMTPDAAYTINGSEISVPVALTGNTATRTLAGTVLVQNVVDEPLKNFSTSDVIYMARTIHEGQPIGGISHEEAILWDCNYIEHKEAILEITEDAMDLIKTKYGWAEYPQQWKITLDTFEQAINETLIWGEKSWESEEHGLPMRHTQGLFHSIKTHVQTYNPATVTDWEGVVNNFLFEHVFADASPDCTDSRLAFAAPRFIQDFALYFRDYRRTATLDPKGIGNTAGITINTYQIPTGEILGLTQYRGFRKGTNLEHWLFCINKDCMELRINKDFVQRNNFQNGNERIKKFMVEWQGGVAWHLEQMHSMLITA